MINSNWCDINNKNKNYIIKKIFKYYILFLLLNNTNLILSIKNN